MPLPPLPPFPLPPSPYPPAPLTPCPLSPYPPTPGTQSFIHQVESFDEGAYTRRHEEKMEAFRAKWGVKPRRKGKGADGGGVGGGGGEVADEGAGGGRGGRGVVPQAVGVQGFGSPTTKAARQQGQRQQQQGQGQGQQRAKDGQQQREEEEAGGGGSEQQEGRQPRWPDDGDPVAWVAAARRAMMGELDKGEAPEGASWSGLLQDEISELPPAEEVFPPPEWLLSNDMEGR